MVCSDNGLRATTREPDGDHEMVLCIPAALLPLELTLRMPDDQGFEDALEFHARDGRATSGVGWLDVIPCDVRSGGEYTFRFQRCRTAAVCRCDQLSVPEDVLATQQQLEWYRHTFHNGFHPTVRAADGLVCLRVSLYVGLSASHPVRGEPKTVEVTQVKLKPRGGADHGC